MPQLRWTIIVGTALLLLLGCTRTLAQEVTVTGQIRPRLETRDLTNVAGEGAVFVSMRTRVGIVAPISPALRALAQIQDVRLWGGELGTTDGDADLLDLHQAWAELGRADATTLRIGRQEASYGAERLVGALDWVQQGRSFDGLRVSQPIAGARVDAFWFQVADEDAGMHADDALLAGVYATVPLGEHAVEAFSLWNTGDGTSQGTAGGRVLARVGVLDARLEGAAQFGERAAADVSAHLLSAELAVRPIRSVALAVLYDRVSGDDEPADGENHAFDTLFGTNHKFYGYADLFLDIPAHTAGRGLGDMALRGRWQATDALTLTLDAHRFQAAAGDGMTDDHFGDELDLVLAWRVSPGLGVSGGAFRFDAADGFAEIGRGDDTLLATYLALDVTF